MNDSQTKGILTQTKRRLGRAGHTLNSQRDLPLLSIIRDSTFINRDQIEVLLADAETESYNGRNRRLALLASLGQLDIRPPHFPYPGRIFSVTESGMDTLRVAGLALLCDSRDAAERLPVSDVLHFLRVNEIRIAIQRSLDLQNWIGYRQLTSLNIGDGKCGIREYDSIAEIRFPDDREELMSVGVQYEQTLKSTDWYAGVQRHLLAESHICRLMCFVDTDTLGLFISRLLYSDAVPVAIIVLSDFQQAGINTRVRVFRKNRVILITLRDFLSLAYEF
jgi:hypothetical protein